MRSSFPLLAVTCLALAFSATAFADVCTFSAAIPPAGAFGWQTCPVLGTSSSYTGDVVVDTGTPPFIIPHSTIGADGYVYGSPSMTLFDVGQTIATGSGMWVVPGTVYTYTGLFAQTGGGRSFTLTDGPQTFGENYIMNWFDGVNYLDLVSPFSASDIGNWTYTETWTDGTTRVSATNEFSVAAVPEPGALLLFGSVLLGLVAYRRKLA